MDPDQAFIQIPTFVKYKGISIHYEKKIKLLKGHLYHTLCSLFLINCLT